MSKDFINFIFGGYLLNRSMKSLISDPHSGALRDISNSSAEDSQKLSSPVEENTKELGPQSGVSHSGAQYIMERFINSFNPFLYLRDPLRGSKFSIRDVSQPISVLQSGDSQKNVPRRGILERSSVDQFFYEVLNKLNEKESISGSNGSLNALSKYPRSVSPLNTPQCGVLSPAERGLSAKLKGKINFTDQDDPRSGSLRDKKAELSSADEKIIEKRLKYFYEKNTE